MRAKPDFTIGRFAVHRIEEWQGRFAPPEALFAGFEAAAFAERVQGFMPDYVKDGFIYGFLQSWLVEAGDSLVLIDTGAGNGKDRPGIPIFGGLDSDFLDRLAQAGFAPGDIDVVINTHLHIDHVGWNTRLEGGAWIPTFPNARYVMPAADRKVWDPDGPHYAGLRGAEVNRGVYEDSVGPIIAAGLAEFVEDGHEVVPGVTLRSAPGHTPGHMLVDISSNGERALFVGDIVHHPMQIFRPDWNSVYCEDQAQAAATRRWVLDEAAQTGARLVPAHFGGAHSVFVRATAVGYEPVLEMAL